MGVVLTPGLAQRSVLLRIHPVHPTDQFVKDKEGVVLTPSLVSSILIYLN